MSDGKKLKITFLPGAFDAFDGTPEELEAFKAEIAASIENMTEEELLANSIPIDLDDPDVLADIGKMLGGDKTLQ